LERFLEVPFCRTVQHSLQYGLDLLNGIKPTSFQLQSHFWKYEEFAVCQITSDGPEQQGSTDGGELTPFTADLDALLLRLTSRT
jgi:hypothetical protein